MIETVDEYCKHKDCVYRSRLKGNGYFKETDCCLYILFQKHSRVCRISQCDKYLTADKYPRIDDLARVEWYVNGINDRRTNEKRKP